MAFDYRNNAERELDAAVEELTEAIRLTVEYVGFDVLPAETGWSWFDALMKYAPEKANRLFFEACEQRKLPHDGSIQSGS